MKRPNILLVMMDQLRWDALGCTGGWVRTPDIDRIAARGVRYAHCYTTSPVCIPARASLATGLYPHNTGVWQNQLFTLDPSAPTWMQCIRDAGYRTSLFGKTHLHPHQGDLRQREHLLHAYGLDDVDEIGGPKASQRVLSHMTARWQEKGLWDVYKQDYRERFATRPHLVRPSPLPLEEYADVYVGQRARSYLASYERDQPWFCWVSFGGPHEPWDAPEPYASMYDPAEMPPALALAEDTSGRPGGKFDTMSRVDFEAGEVGRLRANYAGNVTLIDEQVGRIIDTITARGELENTIIAICSDHGEMNGDYGLLHKETFFDSAARVPLIVRTPQTAGRSGGGRICDAPVEWMDLGPTLVALAGGQMSHRQFGRCLPALGADLPAAARAEALSELSGEFMITDGRWKLVLNARGESYLCFDRGTDPHESRNLIDRPQAAEAIDRLRFRLLERIIQSQT